MEEVKQELADLKGSDDEEEMYAGLNKDAKRPDYNPDDLEQQIDTVQLGVKRPREDGG